ncbi:hypothetical protein [Actinomycetospora termitidis]|uniref:Uncharacterized protein n=1 Tax=Actinomycetospora termitidis TaxID=3053470 RepID=A0ABT7MAK2_9PSEU|nr:hypothetical protein [Actinomycetospora sp. Odt1-22]MDL5157685.1 hypothetical protein [Actinomycetospora sp. Odt1-22]
MNQDRYGRPTDRPTDVPPAAPVMGIPMAYPIAPEGGGVLMVNGVPQPLSRGSSRVMIGAIVFATCVVPLVIIAAVLFMMPDFDAILGGTPSPAVPSVTITPR